MKNFTSQLIIASVLVSSAEGFSFLQTASNTCDAPEAIKNSNPSTPVVDHNDASIGQSRRDSFASIMGAFTTVGAVVLSSPAPASAAVDCFKDCLKNCLIIAPQDKQYCTDSCTDYCAQPDRTDGLSGSVSAENGEVGILGGSFGQGTVPKGEDKVSFPSSYGKMSDYCTTSVLCLSL
mmetsp:Transcript_16457/g.33877  ORF Transcript_16457/g.33877 Transcript_16457/m.33877 type:complete len:178 (+) Transcript_16457:166-699(+)